MNRNDLIGIPDTPKFGYSAVNKNYVDGEITKIDTTQFVKKVGDTMSGVLNMNGNKIKNVGTPYTYENDAVVNVGFFNTELNASNSNIFTQITNAYKQYVDHSHVSPSGQQRDAFRYLMEDTDDSSSENNIQVTGIVDFTASQHQINKKAYEFTLVKDTDGSNDYRSRIGFNIYSLPLGYYTFVVEYVPPEMTNVIVTAQGTTISINSQTTKIFSNYTKTLVKFHNFTKTTPDYIFINLHGKTTSSTTGHLIVYGVEGYVSSVEPKVYDTTFVVENGNMVMQTNLNMNNHKIINLANPTNANDACNKQFVINSMSNIIVYGKVDSNGYFIISEAFTLILMKVNIVNIEIYSNNSYNNVNDVLRISHSDSSSDRLHRFTHPIGNRVITIQIIQKFELITNIKLDKGRNLPFVIIYKSLYI